MFFLPFITKTALELGIVLKIRFSSLKRKKKKVKCRELALACV